MIQAEGDADVDIVKAAVSMAFFQTTTLIAEDTDLFSVSILLLYYTPETDGKKIYFCSDMRNPSAIIYDIQVIKEMLVEDIL